MRVLQYISKSNTFSLYHKLWFYNPYIVASQCCRPKIFQTMNYVELNNTSLKYTVAWQRLKGLENLNLWQKLKLLNNI